MITRLLSLLSLVASCHAFTVSPTHTSRPRPLNAKNEGSSSRNPADDMSDERKATLFQYLLRDLQVEGVPVLGVDGADQVHSMQAAIWTTMAELADQSEATKACLVFEDIPVEALRTFVDDFMMQKQQPRVALPELQRFALSLVGKGVGPAILIDVMAANTTEPISSTSTTINEHQVVAGMKMFVDRVVNGLDVCPHATSADSAKDTPIVYRVCGFGDACHVLSSFWNCICELQAVPESQLGSVMLTMPLIGSDRFAAVAELMGRSLCLYRGDQTFDLLHFSPDYDRSQIHPVDEPAFGHLPPMSWIPAMLQHAGKAALDSNALDLSNYQRRAPSAAVCIKRLSLFDDDSGVELQVGNGETVAVTGVSTYARNAESLAKLGRDKLQSELEAEVAIVAPPTWE